MSRGGPEELLREAQALQQQERVQEAIGKYQELLKIHPDLPDAWYNLGLLLRRTGQFPAALASYQQALNRDIAQPEEVHLNRGVIFSDGLHQYAAAENELKTALTLNPTYVPALSNLANLQEDQGRADDARATYERILGLEPQNADALSRYAGLRNFASPDDPLIQRLSRMLTTTKISEGARATLGFSLGRALDSCGSYDAAFQAYAEANRHSRASAPPGTGQYNRSSQEQFVDRLIAAFPARSPAIARPARPTRPIFICGMFRSGSTLIEQLIADRTDIKPGGELDFLPNLVATALAPFPESMASVSPGQLDSLSAHYSSALGERFPGSALVTDKRPDNFLYIGLIKRLFPDAKIVHTRRNPLDNCLSIFFLHLDQRMSYALSLEDIGHYYVQYRRLMQHWKALYAEDIHDVDYDTYVHHPEPEARRLFEFLGAGDGPQSGSQPREAIKTASVWQVREPLYQRSSGRARNYTRQLASLREYLAAAGV